jgi:hypothetical protein
MRTRLRKRGIGLNDTENPKINAMKRPNEKIAEVQSAFDKARGGKGIFGL